MKKTIVLTATDNVAIIGENVESNKFVSIRGAFAIGKNFEGNNGSLVWFRSIGNPSQNGFNAINVNNNQNQCNPDSFNYPPYVGQELIVETYGLTGNQQVYLEVEYEIMEA
jgi:hypothetical protein